MFTLEESGIIREPYQAFLDSGGIGLTQVMFSKENVEQQLKRLKLTNDLIEDTVDKLKNSNYTTFDENPLNKHVNPGVNKTYISYGFCVQCAVHGISGS